MAATFVAAGAVASASSGNVTPALPTFAVDDILVLQVATLDNVTISLPAGWTIDNSTPSSPAFQSTFAWKRAVAGEAAPLVTHTGGLGIVAGISSWRGA